MTDVAAELRALEARVERLCTQTDTPLPVATRTLLRSTCGILMAARWGLEDREAVRLAMLAGDGNDL